jgi:hypothetical protein
MQLSLSKFIKITPCSRATELVNFQIISTLSNESLNTILMSLSLSQAFTTHHPNVFTPILSLSEGRAGIAWVPSKKMIFFHLRYPSLNDAFYQYLPRSSYIKQRYDQQQCMERSVGQYRELTKEFFFLKWGGSSKRPSVNTCLR